MGLNLSKRRFTGSVWLWAASIALLGSGCSSDLLSSPTSGDGPAGDDGSYESPRGPEKGGDSLGDGDGLVVADPSGSAGEAGVAGAGSAGAPNMAVPPKVPSPDAKLKPQGQLTAGIFDDNLSFDFFTDYLKHHAAQQRGALPITAEEMQASYEESKKQRPRPTDLDISLVIDTTGSMGDELAYLKQELGSLASEISERFPQASQRWSLVVFRDEGDEYVTRKYNFTDDIQVFQGTLNGQTYGGGGDFPEAPDQGIAESVSLSWRTSDDVAKMMFLVADAPHHDENRKAMADAIRSARDGGLHIYPVASSGVDELTERSFRQAAQLTLGRYLFLTDDSGLGGSHKAPTLPCYYVTTLKKAILRSVEAELSGSSPAPTPAETVRFVGGLNDEGNCYYGDGYSARPF